MLIATDIADILLELPRIAEDVFVILGVFEESLGFLKNLWAMCEISSAMANGNGYLQDTLCSYFS